MDGQYFLDLLFKIVEGILVAAAPLVVGLVAAWINKQVKLLQSKIDERFSSKQAWLLNEAAKVAVNAAEQMKLAELIGNKKEYAVVAAQDFLNAHKIHLNVEIVEAAIEAAVLDLNGKSS